MTLRLWAHTKSFFFLQTLSFFLWNLYLKFCFLELRLQKQKPGWIYHNTLENFPYIDSSIAGWVIAVSFINHRVLFLKNTEFQVWPNFSIDLFCFFFVCQQALFQSKDCGGWYQVCSWTGFSCHSNWCASSYVFSTKHCCIYYQPPS